MKKLSFATLALAFLGLGACNLGFGESDALFHQPGTGGAGGNAPDECDVDGDGYVSVDCIANDGSGQHGDDCNDSNANVHPDADEKCNGIDDNCDGNVDEGLAGCNPPADSDGDGDPDSKDCKPYNSNVYHGHVEVCDNGVDDNCVDGIDEGCDNGTGGSGNAPNGGTSVDHVACNDTVVYEITGNAELAMSLRIEGGTVAYNANGADDDCQPGTEDMGPVNCPKVVTSWVIVPDGEIYHPQGTWTFTGCKEDSFRFNVRGWSTVEIEGAPNNDAYACSLYYVDGLSPVLTIKRDGVVISHRDDLVNASPIGDGRNCQINGH